MTVAEIMAIEDAPAREAAIAGMLAEQFPKPMIDRAVTECIDGCRNGRQEEMEAAMKQILPRLYGFLKQIDASVAEIPPARRELFTWTLVKVLLTMALDRVPPGGGRRVAA